MQKGQDVGKIVVRFLADRNTLLNALVPRRLELKPDVSYFPAGDLGRLGQAIANWMADHGAKIDFLFSFWWKERCQILLQ